MSNLVSMMPKLGTNDQEELNSIKGKRNNHGYCLLPSTELLKRHLDYDEETGLFTKKESSKLSMSFGTNRDGYTIISLGDNNQYFRAHRLAWKYIYGQDPEGVVDHMNGDRSNNSKKNLRDLDHQSNSKNRTTETSSSTGYPYVYAVVNKDGAKLYCAQVRLKSKKKLSTKSKFETPEAAYEWVKENFTKLTGEPLTLKINQKTIDKNRREAEGISESKSESTPRVFSGSVIEQMHQFLSANADNKDLTEKYLNVMTFLISR